MFERARTPLLAEEGCERSEAGWSGFDALFKMQFEKRRHTSPPRPPLAGSPPQRGGELCNTSNFHQTH